MSRLTLGILLALLGLFFVLTGCGDGLGQEVQFLRVSGGKSITLDGIISEPKGNGPYKNLSLVKGEINT